MGGACLSGRSCLPVGTLNSLNAAVYFMFVFLKFIYALLFLYFFEGLGGWVG